MENKIGKRVVLNDGEQLVCIKLSEFRNKVNRNKNVVDKKIGDQSAEETDLQGIGGEIAFCKIFNLMPDLSIQVRSSEKGTDKGDVTMSNGLTVDIKTTKYKTGKLITSKNKSICNLHALMIGMFPEYTFKGFVKTEDLMKEENIKDMGKGKTYCVEQESLVELEKLDIKLEN